MPALEYLVRDSGPYTMLVPFKLRTVASNDGSVSSK
jgi:hypothetical protein